MTRTVNIYEAKTNLSRLVELAAAGEEIVIAKAGKPMARLSPLRDGKGPRKPGCLAGKFLVAKIQPPQSALDGNLPSADGAEVNHRTGIGDCSLYLVG